MADLVPGNNCAPLWTFGGTGTLAGPVVDATGVYTVDPQEQSLLALDLATGLPMWSASVTPQEPPVRPAVRNGTVYAVGGNAALAVFEDCGEATCLPVWQGTTGLSAGQSLTPVVARDAVYVARGAGLLHETRVDVFAADGCGAEQCPSLATLAVTGDPLEVMVADGHVVVRTTSGIHVFGLPA